MEPLVYPLFSVYHTVSCCFVSVWWLNFYNGRNIIITCLIFSLSASSSFSFSRFALIISSVFLCLSLHNKLILHPIIKANFPKYQYVQGVTVRILIQAFRLIRTQTQVLMAENRKNSNFFTNNSLFLTSTNHFQAPREASSTQERTGSSQSMQIKFTLWVGS